MAMISFPFPNCLVWQKQSHLVPLSIVARCFLLGIPLVALVLITNVSIPQLHLSVPESKVVVAREETLISEPSMSKIHSNVSLETTRLLPTPILIVGMPKTGTSTIHAFFERSGYRSSHFKCLNRTIHCGLCIKMAIEEDKPPLKTCGDYEVWAQMDVEQVGQCHFPQIHNLEILHQEAPNATLVLNLRNMTRWAYSVQNWRGNVRVNDRPMDARLADCAGGPKSKQVPDLIQWHSEHIQRIRDFVKKHPSHTLIEINIEDPQAGELMSKWFGSASPASNWAHENDSLERRASNMTSRFD